MTENEIFKISLKFVLKWEGGYVNNPNDLGGATNKGITQDTYDNWNKTQNKKIKNILYITNKEIEEIYYKNYWLNTGCNKMSPKFAILSFDTAVNMGQRRVKEFLKIAQWKYPEKFIEARRKKYIEFSKYGNQKIFLQGWLNRLNALEQLVNTIQ